MECITNKSLEDIKEYYDKLKRLRSSLRKDIKASFDNRKPSEAEVESLVNAVFDEYGFPYSIRDAMPTFTVYRKNKSGSESSVNVHKIEKFKDGYKMLYSTENRGDIKVVRVASNGATLGATYDIQNLRATYNAIDKALKNNTVPEQQVFEFGSEYGERVEYNTENATIIEAELINNPEKSLEIFETLLQDDNVNISEEHKELLRETLLNITNMNSKVIPDMIQVIQKTAEKNDGKLVMDGADKGVYVNVSTGSILAGNQMSAAEMYVHELKHASLEYAQRDKTDEVANTISDIEEIYRLFLKEIKEEDFMPPLDQSINRTREREIARQRIEYLRSPKVGLNEFIVMSETNLVVKKILEERITTKGNKNYSGANLFQKLIGLIRRLYDMVYSVARGDAKNLDGATAMSKYIKEISNINNQAIETIVDRNTVLRALNTFQNNANKFLSKHLKNLLANIRNITGTEEGTTFEEELKRFLENRDDYNFYQKSKMLAKLFGKWLTDDTVQNVGAFETWLELLGAKPEGSLQQLIRVFRESDHYEKLIEALGLEANKVEYAAENSLVQQATIIQELFDGNLSRKDASILTQGLIDLELSTMINPLLEGTENDQLNEIIASLNNNDRLNEIINEEKEKLRATLNDEEQYNFILNQAVGLGHLMLTGEGSYAQLPNSYMIYGMSDMSTSKYNIVNKNETEASEINIARIDKIASLEALKYLDEGVRARLEEIATENPNAVLGILKYDAMILDQNMANYANKEFQTTRVKGDRDKIGANWINYRVGLKTDEAEMADENYHPVPGSVYDDNYQLYVNSDFTEPGWVSEGMIMTNDGSRINSYINVFKKGLTDPDEDLFDPRVIDRTKEQIQAELKRVSREVMLEMRAMRSSNYRAQNTGMRPVFGVNKDGLFFVTDLDISVNKGDLEHKLNVKNGVDAVLAKTYSRAIDLQGAKELNLNMINALYLDANDNFDANRNYNEGGKQNLMSYVKIGPAEKNDISKEIWNILPRYVKVKIMKDHSINIFRDLGNLARKHGIENYESIMTDEVEEIGRQIDRFNYDQKKNLDDLIELQKLQAKKIHQNFKALVDRMPSGSRKAEILARMQKIIKSQPYIPVRRNLVYHVFGFRETSLLKYGNSRTINMMVTALKKIDTLWKHLVKIVKSNLVIRDLPVVMMNILSNILLAVLNGQNPITEITEQIAAMKHLHRYRENLRDIEAIDIKMKAGTATKKDVNERKRLESSNSRNPVKPLIDAGLYTSAVEDLSQEDLHKETYLDHLTDQFQDKLPDTANKTLDWLYLTKKTPAFTSLLLFMQYSDFAARYATYNMLVKNGMKHEDAIKKVLDNQINYGFNHGKLLKWLNDRGFILFSKFTEGIQRVIKNTTLEKPFNVGFAIMQNGFLFDDSPLGDSFLSKNLTMMANTPADLFDILTERPALVQILTGKYN